MKSAFIRIAHYIFWVYFILLFIWLAAYLFFGDASPYLGIINLIAVYLFLPLPLTFVIALTSRRIDLWLAFSVGLLAFILLWGGLFLPSGRNQPNSSPQLTVMTYNVLATHSQVNPVIDTILIEDPDIVFIQELNNNLAAEIRSELSLHYPYQVLAPQNNPRGIGTISKYPLEVVEWQFEHEWLSPPQVLVMAWHGRTVRVVNFHMHPTTKITSQQALAEDFRLRENQARDLAQLSQAGYPTILGGDTNSGPLNQAYKILTSTYLDAWRVAGLGLGHTFPTSYIAPELERNSVAGIELPPRIVRIDFIFYSPHWNAHSAWLATEDGVSDHLGVLASLSIKD